MKTAKSLFVFVLLAFSVFAMAQVDKSIKKPGERKVYPVNKKKEISKDKKVNKTSESNNVTNAPSFFNAKFNKNQVWEVTSDPSEPVVGENWTLNVTGAARYEMSQDPTIQLIDWGKDNDRYMMFFAQKGGSFVQITDDISNDEQPTLISVKMFEKNGTQVIGEVFRCGAVLGLSKSGFVYEIRGREDQFKLYFSFTPVKATDVINYIPTKGEVTKLSEL